MERAPEGQAGDGDEKRRPSRPASAWAFGPGAETEAVRERREAEETGAPTAPDRGGVEAEREPRVEKERPWGPLQFLRELPGLIILALVLALLIKSFLIQAFFIPSQSMEPTLGVGDRVLVNKVVYRYREPRSGEIIVFENPRLVEEGRNPLSAFWHWVTEGLGFSSDPTKDFIKRVIGVPGDTIEGKGGRIFVNGERLPEPYLEGNRDASDFGPITIPEGEFFVMGDNRGNSQDSRAFGPVPRDKVVGKAFIILWPPSRFEWLSGDD